MIKTKDGLAMLIGASYNGSQQYLLRAGGGSTLDNTPVLINGTINGYTLAAACAKGVDTSIAVNTTSVNLPTSAAVEARINTHLGIDKVGTVTDVTAGTGVIITGTSTTTPVVGITETYQSYITHGEAAYNALNLTSEDLAGVIDRWDEVVAFLQGISDNGTIALTKFVTTDTVLTVTGSKTFTGETSITSATIGSLVVTGNSTFNNTATFNLTINGNIKTANKWALSITMTVTGAVTGSVSFDGSGAVTLNTTKNHTHDFSELTNKPTTLAGYGITDAINKYDDWLISYSPTSLTFNGEWVKLDIDLSSGTYKLPGNGIYLVSIQDVSVIYSGTFSYYQGTINTDEEILLHSCGTRSTYTSDGTTYTEGVIYAKIKPDSSNKAQLWLAHNLHITNNNITIKIKKLATL